MRGKIIPKGIRDEYASKYGCIWGSHCERCCNFTACYSDGLNK